jgi:prolyl 4-hydroxylase
MSNILKLLLVLIAVLIFIFLIVNFSKLKYFFEKQGFADEDSDYIHPIILENIITEKQNREILEYANPRFYKCKFYNMFRETISMDEVRNSQHTFIPKDTIIVKDLIEKICETNNLPFENAEDLQVVKYEKGNYYRAHHDSYPDNDPYFFASGGHRVLTALIYLNDDFEGGETDFPNLELRVKPVKNRAVIFHPLDAKNKKCHPYALHAGMDVTSGTKYVCNLWIRENKFVTDARPVNTDFVINFILNTYKKIFNP